MSTLGDLAAKELPELAGLLGAVAKAMAGKVPPAVIVALDAAELAAKELPELVSLLGTVTSAISAKTQIATDRAVVQAADVVADLAEREKFGGT